MRREKKYKNEYPIFLTQKREVTSVFRDENGYMVFSEIYKINYFPKTVDVQK